MTHSRDFEATPIWDLSNILVCKQQNFVKKTARKAIFNSIARTSSGVNH
jgi:hypothetical protein